MNGCWLLANKAARTGILIEDWLIFCYDLGISVWGENVKVSDEGGISQ